MPLVWATNIINRARKDGLISSDHIVQTILVELSDIRRRLGALIGYDTVSVPLVYTQVSNAIIYFPLIAFIIDAILGCDFGALYIFYCGIDGQTNGTVASARNERNQVRGSRLVLSTFHRPPSEFRHETFSQRIAQFQYLFVC